MKDPSPCVPSPMLLLGVLLSVQAALLYRAPRSGDDRGVPGEG